VSRERRERRLPPHERGERREERQAGEGEKGQRENPVVVVTSVSLAECLRSRGGADSVSPQHLAPSILGRNETHLLTIFFNGFKAFWRREIESSASVHSA